MQYEYDEFLKNMAIIEEINTIHEHLKNNLNYPNDLGDLLRTQITQSVSAFDKFMHDIVRKGMIEIFLGNRPVTKGYEKYTINLKLYNDLKSFSTYPPEYILELDLIEKQGYISYQDIGKIKEGLSMIWIEDHKWQVLSNDMSIAERALKTEFKNIIIRRNQIVHEFDVDLITRIRRQITEADTDRTKKFIAELVKVIFNRVK